MYYCFKAQICKSNVLCGCKTAKALDQYIKLLEKRKVEGLTEKQANTLIKVAKVVRTAAVQQSSN